MKIDKSIDKYTHRPEVKFISNGWGFEKIIANTKNYCGRLMHIVKGKKTALHLYKIKDRIVFVNSGKIKIYFTQDLAMLKKHLASSDTAMYSVLSVLEEQTIGEGDSFHIPAGMVVQFIAIEESKVYEFSTNNIDGDLYNLINGD